VAQSGENVVDRDGLSIRHPARFVLVGSGNPEEGELRPQLLDRFGLSVEVGTPRDPAERVEVILRRDSFDRDPDGFMAVWGPQDQGLCDQILSARTRIGTVAAPNTVLYDCATLCIAIGSDGLRRELTLLKAARALAALDGADIVTRDHLRRVAPMVLSHRMRRDPLDEAGSAAGIDRVLAEHLP
jgi:magnesium chelatase subunit I